MTGVDHENGRHLINPFIAVGKVGSPVSYYINTSTFGDCQDEIMHPLDRYQDALEEQGKLYVVDTVVGEYNGSPIHDSFSNMLKTVSITRQPRSRTLLGYLPEDVVKKQLPRIFASLNAR